MTGLTFAHEAFPHGPDHRHCQPERRRRQDHDRSQSGGRPGARAQACVAGGSGLAGQRHHGQRHRQARCGRLHLRPAVGRKHRRADPGDSAGRFRPAAGQHRPDRRRDPADAPGRARTAAQACTDADPRRIRLHPDRLPAGVVAAHAQCVDRGRFDHRADAVRVLRAGRADRTAGNHRSAARQPQPGTGNRRRAAHHVRHPQQPGQCGVGGAHRAFWRQGVPHHRAAQRAPGRAPSHGQSIVGYDRTSRGGVAYLGLAGEIVRRQNDHNKAVRPVETV